MPLILRHYTSISRPNVIRIVAESRGKREDKELQHEFQSFRRNGLSNYGAKDVPDRLAATVGRVFPRIIEFAKKSKVIAGLELADLAAYPIAKAVSNETWDNPAYKIVSQKIRALVIS